jgi:hypothetical protein
MGFSFNGWGEGSQPKAIGRREEANWNFGNGKAIWIGLN